MWSNRWTRLVAIAGGIFLINALSRLISRLTRSDNTAATSYDASNHTGWTVVAVLGVAAVIVLLAVISAIRATRQPFIEVFGDLALASVLGALLSLLVGPFIGGTGVFADELEGFVLQFLQFLLFCGVGIFLGYLAMIVAGKDWKSRGLKLYAQRYGPGRKTHGAGR